MTIYVLTEAEAEAYDGDDDEQRDRLWASLHDRYGRESNRLRPGITTEVRHPDGFVVAHLEHGADIGDAS